MTFYYSVGGIVLALHVYVFSDCNPFSEGGKNVNLLLCIFN